MKVTIEIEHPRLWRYSAWIDGYLEHSGWLDVADDAPTIVAEDAAVAIADGIAAKSGRKGPHVYVIRTVGEI